MGEHAIRTPNRIRHMNGRATSLIALACFLHNTVFCPNVESMVVQPSHTYSFFVFEYTELARTHYDLQL